ncbi:MAG: hypothetical protein WC356_02020 [Candidatus Micrarchaeia archaeon]|jgi:hypothetical protein
MANLVGGIRPLSVYDALYVRYVGATADVNLGTNGIYAADANFGGNTNYTHFDSNGVIAFNGTASIVIPHLMQSDSTDQAIINASNAQIINFDTDVHHNGITRTDANTFTITKAGSYLICFSGVTQGVINEYIDVWLKKNSSYVANSNTIYQYKSNNATAIVAVSFIEHFAIGDTFEFWTWGSSTGDKWDATAAGTNPTRPACPSIIITANFVGND